MDTIRLSDIAGLSKFNARQTVPQGEELEEMKSSILAKGVTHPLMLRMEGKKYRVLDGGRRYYALKGLEEEGKLRDPLAPYILFVGNDEEAYEASLISFVQRRDLHPVDEFERFIELRDRFTLDEAAIAERTGKSLRFVKQRLRLARLAPQVREAWRKGEITTSQAQAFCATDNMEAQEALLAEPHMRHLNPIAIANKLSDDARIAVGDPRAVFVGLDVYAAAGGRLDEQLFIGDGGLYDEAILDRLARAKLEAEGERICREEGWGWYETQYSVERIWDVAAQAVAFDYTEEERKRENEIDELIDEACDDDKEIDRLNAEREAIDVRAMLRAVSQGDRATLGIYLELDEDSGRLTVERALRQKEQRPAAAGESAGGRPPAPEDSNGGKNASAKNEEEEKLEALGKSTRAILDAAATKALHETIARNPRLALVYAVAKLGRQFGGEALRLSGEGRYFDAEIASPLLNRIEDQQFNRALATCAEAEIDDKAALLVAFSELIGRSVATDKAGNFDEAKVMIAVASRFADIDGALKRAFDYEAYFKSEARGAAIEAIRAIDGEAAAGEAAKLKKPELVKRAALLARDRAWLPEALASALGVSGADVSSAGKNFPDARSTAEAMRDAIDADEARETEVPWAERVDAVCARHSAPLFGRFLKDRVAPSPGSEIKVKELRLAFEEFGADSGNAFGAKRFPAPQFSRALEELGIEKKKGALLDIAIIASGDAQEESEAGAEASNGERNDALDKRTRLETFIELCCHRGNDALDAGMTKASEFYSAFGSFCDARELPRISLVEFGQIVGELGIEKKRLKTGVHYLNIALRTAPSLERSAPTGANAQISQAAE
jgi:ParB family chromosome partitioning protein